MKYFLISALLMAMTMNSLAQIKIPAASPLVSVTQEIGLTEFTLSYSRPSLNHRIAFGKDGILPYDELWRTGANSATYLQFPMMNYGELELILQLTFSLIVIL